MALQSYLVYIPTLGRGYIRGGIIYVCAMLFKACNFIDLCGLIALGLSDLCGLIYAA